MKCEICHKNDATTAYTHIVDDTKKTLLLCGNCIPQSSEKKKNASRSEDDQSPQSVPQLIKKVKVEFNTAGSSEATENVVFLCGSELYAVRGTVPARVRLRHRHTHPKGDFSLHTPQ